MFLLAQFAALNIPQCVVNSVHTPLQPFMSPQNFRKKENNSVHFWTFHYMSMLKKNVGPENYHNY